ncbi:MAG: hypothetical protein JWO83_906 [Caulobacteraceae bacterium]|jgi:hypothetical protein|nr:hypothetical protein [Caulobacteraceae bacterium]
MIDGVNGVRRYEAAKSALATKTSYTAGKALASAEA